MRPFRPGFWRVNKSLIYRSFEKPWLKKKPCMCLLIVWWYAVMDEISWQLFALGNQPHGLAQIRYRYRSIDRKADTRYLTPDCIVFYQLFDVASWSNLVCHWANIFCTGLIVCYVCMRVARLFICWSDVLSSNLPVFNGNDKTFDCQTVPP